MIKNNGIPMRVTFLVAELENSGGVRVLAHYAQGLLQNGHKVLVVAPAPRPNGRVDKLKNKFGLFFDRRPPNHFDRLGIPVKMLSRYRAIKKSDVPDADIVVATWWKTAVWVKEFPLSKGRKVHFVQDYEIWNGQKAAVDAALALPFPKITISRWLVNILEGLGQSHSEVIANGVDHELFWSPSRERPLKPTVGFVYTDNSRKGADIAINAIKQAQSICPELHVVVFGHAPPRRPINLSNLTFIASPDQAEIREIYRRCTAWLFPSREEGFGLPILESMACGTPVIACPSGAAPEILAAGGGTLLNSFEADEMASEIMKYVHKRESDWQKISSRAAEISKVFQWQKSISNFEKKLHELHQYNLE